MNSDDTFVNHHAPADWRYTYEGNEYLKVGCYEAVKVELIGEHCVADGREFPSIALAYMTLNKEWLEHDRSVK